MRVGLGRGSCSATLNCHARRRGRSLWRWKAFPTSRCCGVSSRRHGSYCRLRASGSSWNVVSSRSLRRLLSFPFFRPSDATSAVLFITSSGPFGHIKWRGMHAVTSSIHICFCKADFGSTPRVLQHLEVGAKRCVLAWKSGALEPFSDDAVAAADQQDCAHRRQCKREGRSHLAGPPMLRGGAERLWLVGGWCSLLAAGQKKERTS